MRRQDVVSAVLLGAVLATVSPARADVVDAENVNGAPSTAAPAPCAHRALCGPIRLLPRDPSERRAFVARVLLQAVDGIVTSAGQRAGTGRLPNLTALTAAARDRSAVANFNMGAVNATSWRITPTFEADPFVAPASHGGLRTLLAGGLLWTSATARIQHRWSAQRREQFDELEAASHLVGIATWLPRLAARRALDGEYRTCAETVAQFGGWEAHANPNGPGTIPTSLNVHTADPSFAARCQRWSSLPIHTFAGTTP